MVGWLVAPFVGHFGLVVVLFVALTVLRLRAVGAGETTFADYARPDADRGAALRVQRNLANQFEAPLFAYVAMVIILIAGAVTAWDVVAAWIFLAGRIVHSAVQTLTDAVRLRGQVFTINFIGIMMLVGHVAWLVITGGLS